MVASTAFSALLPEPTETRTTHDQLPVVGAEASRRRPLRGGTSAVRRYPLLGDAAVAGRPHRAVWLRWGRVVLRDARQDHTGTGLVSHQPEHRAARRRPDVRLPNGRRPA